MKKLFSMQFVTLLNPSLLLVLYLLTGLFFWTSPGNALDLNVFGDVTFGDSNLSGKPSGFSLGQLDFWATQETWAHGGAL